MKLRCRRALAIRMIELTQHGRTGSLRCSGRYSGTYLESPAYLLKAGKRIDQLPIEAFVNDAVLLDLAHKKPMHPIDDEDLEGAEETAGLAIRERELVLLRTGWDRYLGRREYFLRHPGLSENGAQYLEFKHVSGVGIDAPCLDLPNSSLLAHKTLLRRKINVVENLCNLNCIGQPRFHLVIVPMKVRVARSMARAIAFVD
jgi:kynurenine formamidase